MCTHRCFPHFKQCLALIRKMCLKYSGVLELAVRCLAWAAQAQGQDIFAHHLQYWRLFFVLSGHLVLLS